MKMSEKAENVQRKTLKDLQKAGELLIRTTLKMTGQSGCLEGNRKKWGLDQVRCTKLHHFLIYGPWWILMKVWCDSLLVTECVLLCCLESTKKHTYISSILVSATVVQQAPTWKEEVGQNKVQFSPTSTLLMNQTANMMYDQASFQHLSALLPGRDDLQQLHLLKDLYSKPECHKADIHNNTTNSGAH